MRKNLIYYVGMDVHKNYSFVTALTRDGEIVAKAKVENFSKEFYNFFERLSDKAKLSLAIESTEMIMPFIKALERYAESIKVCHPLKARLIAEAKIKTDKLDSLTIANLLRTNYLPESYIPREEIRELRSLCRERFFLKFLGVRIKNRIWHNLLARGILVNENIFTQEKRKWLRGLNFQEISRALDLLEEIEAKIVELNEEIQNIVCTNEIVELLTTIPGIGLYSASLLYAEIADIDRFKSFSKLCCYSGLNPRLHQSGNKRYFGKISKQGNKLIRWILIQAAWIAIKYDIELKNFYERIKKEKGSRKAIVAIARKLLKRVYAVWKRKGPYQSKVRILSSI